MWIRVTKRTPCPICGHDSWCSVTDKGDLVYCMRIESDKPHEKGGWLHRPDGTITVPKGRTYRAPSNPKDWAFLAKKYREMLSVAAARTLATQLAVEPTFLRVLGLGWTGRNYTFPMYDGKGNCIGIRLRSPNGDKFCVRGSKNGIFWTEPVYEHALFLPEGPTDAAALLCLGLDAWGRPSCSAGAEYIKNALSEPRDIVICADNDKPGIRGAYKLAKDIWNEARSIRILVPPAKDIRAWYNLGGTRQDVLDAVEKLPFVKEP